MRPIEPKPKCVADSGTSPSRAHFRSAFGRPLTATLGIELEFGVRHVGAVAAVGRRRRALIAHHHRVTPHDTFERAWRDFHLSTAVGAVAEIHRIHRGFSFARTGARHLQIERPFSGPEVPTGHRLHDAGGSGSRPESERSERALTPSGVVLGRALDHFSKRASEASSTSVDERSEFVSEANTQHASVAKPPTFAYLPSHPFGSLPLCFGRMTPSPRVRVWGMSPATLLASHDLNTKGRPSRRGILTALTGGVEATKLVGPSWRASADPSNGGAPEGESGSRFPLLLPTARSADSDPIV